MFWANLFCSHETDCSREKVEDRALKRTEGVYYCSLIWLRSMQCNVSSQARKTTFSFFCHVLTLHSTDTQWRQKLKKSDNVGQCGRQNMLLPCLKIWEWELIFGRAVKTISSPSVRSPCPYLYLLGALSWHLFVLRLRLYALLQIGLWNLTSTIDPITSTTLGSTLKNAIE